MQMPSRASRWVPGLAVAVLALAAGLASGQSATGFTPVTDAMLQDPAPEDWLTWRRTLDGWGYSPLDQIDRGNVGRLRMVWSRGLATGRQEGTPLAYDGVLYMPQSSDVIEAIDAVTGDLKWQHRRNLPDDVYDFVGGNARNNRNIAIYDRFIVNTSDDDYFFGLDAATGEIAWETQIFDYKVTPAGHSSGPIIADGQGHLGAELPSPRAVPSRASSWPTTRGPAKSCGGGGRCRRRASRATRPGAACPTRSGCTSARGCRPATTPSCG